MYGNVINGRFLTTDTMLSRHRLRHLPGHGDGSADRSHRQQQRYAADNYVENDRTVCGMLSRYRRTGSRDNPFDTR